MDSCTSFLSNNHSFPNPNSTTTTTTTTMVPSFIPQFLTPPSASSLFTTYASISALLMLLRSILHEFLPKPLRDFILSSLRHIFHLRSNHLTLVLEEQNPNGIGRNHFYDAAELYLGHKITSPSTNRLKISKSYKDTSPMIRFEKGERIQDTFEGIPLQWSFCCLESEKRRRRFDDDHTPSSSTFETRLFELAFDKRYQTQIINSYLPFIEEKYNSIKDKQRALKLHTLGPKYGGPQIYWDNTNLDHPSTFDTLAMDYDRKSDIINDLDRFVKRKEFYRKVGRAWKRGYLLYGPPGTGKSSLVAAIANHLRFDIYDLQLGSLLRDSDLRRVLLSIPSRSVLVIEDIDCSVEIKNRSSSSSSNNEQGQKNSLKPLEPQLSLSGLLNFIDGLWSSCGDERIIALTTNHKEKLDPALLRPGRMDKHIELSYLTIEGFRNLVSIYFDLNPGEHPMFERIENLIEDAKVTPAEVAEQLMRSDEDVDQALEEVRKLVQSKM